MTMIVQRVIVVLSLLLCILPAKAEIRRFHETIEANETFLHYSEGFLIAPGYIDLRNLEFKSLLGDKKERKKMIMDSEKDGDRNLFSSDDNTKIDLVFFNEPSLCPGGKILGGSCDWSNLGLGATDEDGNYRWCCSESAVEDGFCEEDDIGRLIVNDNLVDHIVVDSSGKLKDGGKLEAIMSGKYILAISNCNNEGQDVRIEGDCIWKSAGGYLPGNLFSEMYFFISLAAAYIILAVAFGIKMKMHQDAYIPIQKWIVTTILLGLLEITFRVVNYNYWNKVGIASPMALYTAIFIGCFKGGLSRCLLVMVSLGWGVVRDQLDAMTKIIILGVAYVTIAMTNDVLDILSVTESAVWSVEQETELLDVSTLVTFLKAALNVTFYMWILDGLNMTMEYLENMNQNRKLSRYLRLRCILLFSILFAVMWSVMSLVNAYDAEGILDDQSLWIADALIELNYFFILVTIAYLWRPNSNAKEFAHVIELPTLGDDEDDLQMTENAACVPSALDGDDDDTDYSDNNNNKEQYDDGFQQIMTEKKNDEKDIDREIS